MTVHGVTVFLHIGSPDVQSARCSVHWCCCHHDLRNWCRCWHRDCHICGKCIGCHLSRRRVRVPLRTLQRREEFEVPTLRLRERLRTFLVLYTPLGVMISISSLRSLMPMNAPSCHLGSNFACLAPPGRIGMKYTRSPNSTNCLRYGLPACNS